MAHRCTPAAHLPIPPPAAGWAVPQPGDQVLFRPECAADLIPATVTAVDMDDAERVDGNVWGALDEEGRIMPNPVAPVEAKLLLPNPNPNVSLDLVTGRQATTRHIRYVDSPGWAWPDQEA